jgi:hypothetical protein
VVKPMGQDWELKLRACKQKLLEGNVSEHSMCPSRGLSCPPSYSALLACSRSGSGPPALCCQHAAGPCQATDSAAAQSGSGQSPCRIELCLPQTPWVAGIKQNLARGRLGRS